ncbi:MAG: UvrB/UvrC motif-containing protein [Synergistaceae bacterium]|jgi:protein arginine kinase activator|nr:UvrB/UvrC motif-containing protein [Synergistaceae bacterium]
MLCSNCGKREVEVLIKQVVNNEVHNLNLCRACAEELGFISPDIPSITISFSLGDAEPLDHRKPRRMRLEKKDNAYDALLCSACGMEYSEFRSSGVLGCPECYESFRFPLGARFQREQGAESHWSGSETFAEIGVLRDIGETEITRRVRDERLANIDRLRHEIQDAVSREEYERAAELRNILSPLLCESEEKDD